MNQQGDSPSDTKNKWALPLAALGALLLVAAAILAWVVVPNNKQMPADTDITRHLDGTAKLLLNPQAVATGDLRNALLRDAPVTAERNVKTLATDGNVAEVADIRSLKTADGKDLGRTEVNYAVDRKTLEAAADHPADWQVAAHTGLTVSWPIGAEQKDYTAWINETQTTVPVKFQKEDMKLGVHTYVYHAESEAAPIKDPQVLAALPKQLPGAVLGTLAPQLDIPDAAKALLAQALPSLGDPITLNYTYQVTSTYWVEPTTGLVVDTEREEIRKVSPGAAPLAAPIYDVTTKFTQQSVADAAKDANSKANKINLYSRTLPLILLVAGLLALIAGVAGWLMRKRSTPAPVETAVVRPRDEDSGDL